MKKSMLLTLSVLMTLSATSAMAVGVRAAELRTRFEREIRDGQANMAAGHQETVQAVSIELAALSNGQANQHDLAAALNKNFDAATYGLDQAVSMMSVAQSVRDAKKTLDQINRNDLVDDQAKALFDQKERAIKSISKFLSLASLISPGASKEVKAFVKELSLAKDGLATMDTAELKSHLDIMDAAVAAKIANPEMFGDQALSTALKAKFGNDRYASKLDEILGCAR